MKSKDIFFYSKRRPKMKKVKSIVSALLLLAMLAITLPVTVNAAALNGSSVKKPQ